MVCSDADVGTSMTNHKTALRPLFDLPYRIFSPDVTEPWTERDVMRWSTTTREVIWPPAPPAPPSLALYAR
jgi:hypothetical protein